MSSWLSRAQQIALVELAARSPSAHNIQPARWRFRDRDVELLEEPSRWLRVGDPTGRDNQIALGMAWEGMALALTKVGLSLAQPRPSRLPYPPESAQPRVVAIAPIQPGADPDPLTGLLHVRRCHRGPFERADARLESAIDSCIARHADHVTRIAPALHGTIARWYDAAVVGGLRNDDFVRELRDWSRFSHSDPDWARDGLSADCLALTRLEAVMAEIVLRPKVLRIVLALGMGGLVASEAAKIRSATALVAVHAHELLSDFAAGRAWYRFWLDLAGAGVAAVPLSALVDSPEHAKQMAQAQPLPAKHRAINFLRLGPAPRAGAPLSARLPATELLLS